MQLSWRAVMLFKKRFVLLACLVNIGTVCFAQVVVGDTYKDDYIEACRLISKYYIYLEQKTGKSPGDFLEEQVAYANTIDWNKKNSFISSMRRLRSMFPDGHFDIELDRKYWPISRGKYLGFTVTINKDGKAVVGKVYSSFTTQISVGDEIIKWNDIDVMKEINRIAKVIPQSTQIASLELAARQLTFEYPNKPIRESYGPVKIQIRERINGRTTECYFPWKDCSATIRWQKNSESDKDDLVLLTPSGIVSLESLPNDAKYINDRLIYYVRSNGNAKYVVLHPRSFAGWTAQELEDTFRKILEESPSVLIVDLFDSAGGYFDQVLYLSHALNVSKKFKFLYDSIDTKTGNREQGIGDFGSIENTLNLKNIWKGKLVIRINPVTKSAGDFFSRWMQINNRATIIGQPSAGAGGGTDDFVLTNTKTIVSIPMRDRTISNDKYSIEGHSVTPDDQSYPDWVF